MYVEIQKSEIEKWRVVHQPVSECWRRVHAHCDGSRKICKHEIKESYASLWLLLHEIGHLETTKAGMKRCIEESEATRWCIQRMKELGLPIKRKYLNDYKEYIRRTYDRGMRRGLTAKVKSKLLM